ncbi:unnamed protein product [Lathyrus oleraceus]
MNSSAADVLRRIGNWQGWKNTRVIHSQSFSSYRRYVDS